jgi:23S rRNA pseudouridine1911/1915/1917 synthase
MAETTPDAPSPVDPEGLLAWRVTDEEAGSRIDRILGRLLAPDYSRSYLAALITEGTLTVDGSAVKPNFRVSEGMQVAGDVGKPAASLPGPEDMDLEILHEDEAVIMVNKPVGVVIHPGTGAKEGTLVNGLLGLFPELSTVGRADRPGIVHRLDRETSGVLIVARTNEAAKSIVNQFKAKTVRKEYAAVVWGEMPFDSDWIDLPLGQHPRKPQLRAVVKEGGQPSSTFYEVKERYGMASLVAAYPRTGRTHQIRVHLEHIGFPIVGDPQYGPGVQVQWRRWCEKRVEQNERAPVLDRCALHARAITFRHPLTDEDVTYEAPLPADMADLVEVLGSL